MDISVFMLIFVNFLRIIEIAFIILAIIFVHEMGHYLVARWCKIKACVFSLGFGPEILSFTDKHGTKWRWALFPLGGYVRFRGDEDIMGSGPAPNEPLLEGSFFHACAWKRALTVFAGPFFNGILSLIIFAFVFFLNGRLYIEPIIGNVVDGMPAQFAGLQKGDRILSIDGEPILSFEDLTQKVALEANRSLNFSFSRDGTIREVSIVPKPMRQSTIFNKKVLIGVVGITPPEDPAQAGTVDRRYLKEKKYNVFQSLQESFKQIKQITIQTLRVLGRLLIGREDRCQLSGPTHTISVAWQISAFGFWSLINFMGFLSIGIALINLFPIPPLDGGHLFFYIWEGMFREPVSEKIKEIIYKIGTFLVLFFIVFAILNDFVAC